MSNTTTRYYLGVDPGKTGSFVFLPTDFPANPLVHFVTPLQGTEVDVPSMLAFLKAMAPQVEYAALEDVHALFGSSAKSTFNFGHTLGLMECALHAAGIPFVKVAPKTWQKLAWKGVDIVQAPTARKSKKTGEFLMKTDTKQTSLLAARELFPGESFLSSVRSRTPHDGIVDAALISYWCKVVYLHGTK